MLYMVIEKFRPGKVKSLYERLEREGRFIPEGVTFINSWVDMDLKVCYQVMESESREKLQQWMDNWEGYCDWEVIPVMTSLEAKFKALRLQ